MEVRCRFEEDYKNQSGITQHECFKFQGLEDRKLKTIAIMNLKGGTAKTCTTLNLAAIFAHDYKQRVLVVDADSQSNTTEFLKGDPSCGSLAKVLRRAEQQDELGTFALYNVQPTYITDIWLLAADDTLMDLDLTKIELGSVQITCLKAMTEKIRERDIYNIVLIDCPPAFNAASAATLLAADGVLIPIKLDAFSLRGMGNLLHQIANMRKINPKLCLLGMLPTMWYKSANIESAETQLKAAGLPVLPHIRRSNKMDDMTFAQQPLIVSSPRSAACKDYRALAAELMREVISNG